MARNQEVIIRVWDLGNDNSISLEDVKVAFQDIVAATDLPISVGNSNSLGFNTVVIQSSNNTQYMPVHNYLQHEGGSLLLVTSVAGKGPEVKAEELEKLYYKAVGAWSDFKYGLEKGKQVARYFGNSTRAAGIAGGIGAATGLAIRGTFKLAAKGVRALLRDKEAYEAEMAFYTMALGAVDYIAGGVDTTDIVKKIEEGANNNNAIAQYLFGNAYAEGRGIDQNLDEAFAWFVKAAENGELRSQNIVSGEYLYSTEKEYTYEEKQKGVEYLYNLAEHGEVWACSLLIDIFGRGSVDGITRNYEEAIRIAQFYADYDPLFSATFLAPILDTSVPAYEKSLNSYKNDALAFKAYQIILEGEDKTACEDAAMRLAFMCKEGRGTEQSNSEAVNYLIKASNYGNQDAKLALIDAYSMGIGVEQSEKTASKYANELLKIGNPHYIPSAYYALFKIADGKELYKESMKMARNYLACENTDPVIRERLNTYLEDLEARISQMTDEERREFLKEPKKISIDPKYYKWIAIAAVAIIAVIGIVSVIGNVSKDSSYDDGQSSYNADSYSLGTPTSAEASSELAEQGNNTYFAENAIDGDESTAWVEGVSGDGVDESISVTFDNEDPITALRISNGYQKSGETFQKNNRVENMEARFEDGSVEAFTLFDNGYPDQIIFLSSPKEGHTVELTIKSTYPGSDYDDTCISEIGLARGDMAYPSSTSMVFAEPLVDMYEDEYYDEDVSDDSYYVGNWVARGTTEGNADYYAWTFEPDGSAYFITGDITVDGYSWWTTDQGVSVENEAYQFDFIEEDDGSLYALVTGYEYWLEKTE